MEYENMVADPRSHHLVTQFKITNVQNGHKESDQNNFHSKSIPKYFIRWKMKNIFSWMEQKKLLMEKTLKFQFREEKFRFSPEIFEILHI